MKLQIEMHIIFSTLFAIISKIQSKEIKFETKTGREAELQFNFVNSKRLQVKWWQSFDVDPEVIRIVQINRVEKDQSAHFGEAKPPYNEDSEIFTNQDVDLCLPQDFVVYITPKQKYTKDPFYKMPVHKESTYYAPDFSQVNRFIFLIVKDLKF